jgi:hypothetical protein
VKDKPQRLVRASRHERLAQEYYDLNWPHMTMQQANAEADFWCDYLESRLYHTPNVKVEEI